MKENIANIDKMSPTTIVQLGNITMNITRGYDTEIDSVS